MPEKFGKGYKETMKIYIDKDGFFIVVAKGSQKDGGYTFYRRKNPTDRGKRIKGRGRQFWYNSVQEANEALVSLAKEKKWTEHII
uniref:Uncharacterized protein n=1 Tax=viral metagenome TaxID=1070528 RepID=A0A6M3J0Y3_9ZZZZ